MQYKTMILELLQQHPEIYDQLLNKRTVLSTLELFASELKTRHEAWKDLLAQAKPGSDPSQIASEALEIAIQGLEELLLCGSPPDDSEPLSLDAAMAFLRRHHTPPA